MRRVTASLFFCGLLSSCAVTPQRTPSSEVLQKWQDRTRVLATLEHWIFDGRIVVNTENEGWNGSVRWSQRGATHDIDFRAPLGQGTLLLHGEPGLAVLNLPDHQVLRGSHTDSLMHQHFGWSLPIDALQQWVLGRADPTAVKNVEWDEQGRIARLTQAGWKVEFKRYARIGEMELPDKIFAATENLRVRLVIDQWTLP